MATPRLPFLWPMLYRPARAPRIRDTKLREGTPLATCTRRERRQFTTTPRKREDTVAQRYGKAQEPAPHLRDAEALKDPTPNTGTPAILEKNSAPELNHDEAEEEEEELPTTTTPPTTPSKPSAVAIEDTPPPVPPPEPPKTAPAKPLDSVLHMPSANQENEYTPPHLKTPPYVHHFDTYTLVRELTRSKYTPVQATTLMKAVRGMLTTNLELARDGLVSKSNVENETYLFRAACSELKTEIGNTRKGEIERMRTERNQLQHEVDILGQRLGQETGGLRDELKGLSDDRKMGVRGEQRGMDSKIQELNYKITVALNSDARSEVEGLRWVLTRRAAIFVGVSAFMLFVALRYGSYVQHQQAEQKKNGSPKSDPPKEGDGQSPSEGSGSDGGGNGNGSGGGIGGTIGVVEREGMVGSELLAGEGVSLG